MNGGLGVEKSIFAGGDITAYASSDRRLKKNIRTIKNPLEKLMELNGVEFRWDEKKQDLYKGKDVSVIAQDVQMVLPSAVRESTSGYLQVNYDKIIPLLIEAIKEQQFQINDLKRQLKK